MVVDGRAIGIFDSGVGGLTVARAVLDLLPHEPVVYFGDQARMPYGPRSLDEGFIPPILDESVLDGKQLVAAEDALRWTRELAEREGIFAGISSGAVLHVGRRVAEKIDEGDVVCLLADGGWKYLSTEAWTGDPEQAAKKVGETLWW